MPQGIGSIIRAVVLSAALGAVMIPACTIRVGHGTGEDDDAPLDPTGGTVGSGGQAGNGGASGLTPEEEAAFDALQNTDPQEVARAGLAAEYAAYMLHGLVETNAGDPATVDEATVNQLLEEYAPIAWDQAVRWVQSLDPSTIPQAHIRSRDECASQFGCRYVELCDFDIGGAGCPVTGCGEGACSACPKIFGDLSKLIVTGWCSHTCMIGSAIVGIKLVLHLRLNREWEKCIKLETPIP